MNTYETEQVAKRAVEALKGLLCCPFIRLEDQGVDSVKEAEMKGWDGPGVKAFGEAINLGYQVLKEAGWNADSVREEARANIERAKKLAQYESLKKELGL